MLLALKSSNSEETVFLHLFLACYTLRKMANFATFQNRVTLLMLSGFEAVFPIKHLLCVFTVTFCIILDHRNSSPR